MVQGILPQLQRKVAELEDTVRTCGVPLSHSAVRISLILQKPGGNGSQGQEFLQVAQAVG